MLHPSRATVMGSKYAVTSSHPLATLAGVDVLKKGGNVVDAAIAVSSVLCVVQNNMCGLGGDLFALIRSNGRVYGLNASGRAAEAASVDYFRNKGYTEIPKTGPLAAVTVPGIVSGWGELQRSFGTFELPELMQDSARIAEEGFPMTKNYSNSILNSSESLGRFRGWRETFLPGGSVPETGYILKQPHLATTLREIAIGGPENFYRGDLMDRITKGIEAEGGILAAQDFEAHYATWDQPVMTEYRGFKVFETAPNSQGATVLLWLNMLEDHDLSKIADGSPELMELMFRTGYATYTARARHIADPAFHPFPTEFLSKEFARRLEEDSRPEWTPGERTEGDTTYFAVANADGDCVSVIQSNYMGFGSGLMPPGTGVVLHNRGCYFTLEDSHHNKVEPRKRTFHTLCASIIEREGRPAFVLGSMGGDVQPQIHVQLITALVDRGSDVQLAIDSPRWGALGTIYEKSQTLVVEEGLQEQALLLRKKGYPVRVLKGYSSLLGHAQAIAFGSHGELMAGADPRGDGAAIGF